MLATPHLGVTAYPIRGGSPAQNAGGEGKDQKGSWRRSTGTGGRDLYSDATAVPQQL